MNFKIITLFLLSICCLISFTSCSLTSELAPSREEQRPEIESVSSDVLKTYTAFYVPDITVLSIEGDVLRRVDQAEVEGLVSDFRNKIIRQLGSKHTVFSQPSRNVGKIKITVSDVSTTYTLFQLYPGALIPNQMRGGASIEAIISDSMTGKQLVKFRHSKQGERQGFLSGLGKWDGMKKAFDEWARELGAAVN